MNYAPVSHTTPSVADPGAPDALSFPWEQESGLSPARQETWLLSFIDILALLLTLFVLLLAIQDRQSQPGDEIQWLTALPDATYGWLGALDNPFDAGLLDIAGPVRSGDREASVAATGGEKPQLMPAAPAGTRSFASASSYSGGAPAAAGSAREGSDSVPAAGTDSAATLSASPQPSVAAATPADVAPATDQAPREPVPARGATPPEPAQTLQRRLAALALDADIDVIARPGAVNLEISDNILFQPASAALSASGLALLRQLSEILRTLPYEVSVEGHTDNVPIHTPRYPSNWELSTARATQVTRKLIELGVAGDRLRAIGYGATRPRNDNLTPASRAKNRRVTLVLAVDDPQ